MSIESRIQSSHSEDQKPRSMTPQQQLQDQLAAKLNQNNQNKSMLNTQTSNPNSPSPNPPPTTNPNPTQGAPKPGFQPTNPTATKGSWTPPSCMRGEFCDIARLYCLLISQPLVMRRISNRLRYPTLRIRMVRPKARLCRRIPLGRHHSRNRASPSQRSR